MPQFVASQRAMHSRFHMTVVLAYLFATGSAVAEPAPDRTACMSAIAVVQRDSRLPNTVLEAVARVESGRLDVASRMVVPWPWSINVLGVGHFYESKADAVTAVKQFQAAGQRSIDVGCMQINLVQHPAAFATLEEAFDPGVNVAYGASFLQALFRRRGDWPSAIAAYHSSTPAIGADYLRRVVLQASSNPKLVGLLQTAAALERSVDPGIGSVAFANRATPVEHLAPLDLTPGLAQYRADIANDRRRNLVSAGIVAPPAARGGRLFAQRAANTRNSLN